MSLATETLVCGVAGCTDAAVRVVRHPDHGRRVVCDGHADGLEVVGDVE